jgi:ABC-2 type transport system ATP-binding protein
LRGLKKSFGTVKALDGLSLDISQGIFGLIGPNGAGKTTLLRALLGLIQVDEGSINILGYDLSSRPLEVKRHIGVLHEKPYFPPAMTTQSYLKRVGQVYGTDEPVKDYLELVGLGTAGDRKIGHLSAGMHQRLGIAQALIGKPSLVFLDEPTSNLDVKGRDAVVSVLVRVNKELGVSFFVTSHILSELERVCEQVAFIKAGKIVDKGAVSGLVEKFTANRYEIVSSDPTKLLERVGKLDGVMDAFVSGVSSIIVEIDQVLIPDPQAYFSRAAEEMGITVFKIGATGSLEDVYRKVNQDD